jgi:hypothetical protein
MMIITSRDMRAAYQRFAIVLSIAGALAAVFWSAG